jgi:hypothetical protein
MTTTDLKDLYVNIHIDETVCTTRIQLLKHNDQQTTNQICNMLRTILGQNYFAFQDNCYQADKGVAMGSPLSGTTAEIFLQHLENLHIKPLLDSKCITFYSRYMDDIIIYDATCTNLETII